MADTQRLARKAAELIDIEYEVLEPVTDPARSARARRAARFIPSAAPTCSANRRSNAATSKKASAAPPTSSKTRTTRSASSTCSSNPKRASRFRLRCGCRTRGAGHGRFERPARNRAIDVSHIYTQGQGVFDDQRQIASVLGIERDRVQTELVSNGGAFGGKEDMSIQAQTALMAWLIGRPVKLTLTRLESFHIHPKRHPIELTYKIGCDAEGRITAVQARIIGDKGAYASVGAKVLERAGGHCTGPYRVPAIDMESLAVYTNNPPCGAMRGFGANQSAFAIEGLLDRLAEKVGIDGYDIRDRNILEPRRSLCHRPDCSTSRSASAKRSKP